ncbi:MAG TPA: hypothetical protein VKY74_00395, partial [Chloroflexia bacterium]|nr:hypothetical protein [Chloroflexia bacterium]
MLALAADAWVFLTRTNATRTGVLDQTLGDRPARLQVILTDEATSALAAARYLARVAALPLAADPPDLPTLQQSVNDIYYRFGLDRFGFDLVRIYPVRGPVLLSVAVDPGLDATALPGPWT